MENHPGLLVAFLFFLFEAYAALLAIFGAPLAIVLPVVLIAAALKVTYDMFQEKRQK